MYVKVSHYFFLFGQSILREYISSIGRPYHTTRKFRAQTHLRYLAHGAFQHYTFYDFIINKARGKSGPLFNFDVHDDVRLLADATKEKDESHAGKVVERSYYQRNKHIFPASRWEVSLLRCPFLLSELIVLPDFW